MQLGKIKKTLLEALATSGKILLRGMARKKKISFKSSVSLVTETDIASEKNILRLINKRFPDHSILAEESGASKKKSPHRWIIDPLDGTTNFAHDFPQACISIAYEFQKEVLLGGRAKQDVRNTRPGLHGHCAISTCAVHVAKPATFDTLSVASRVISGSRSVRV